MLKMNKFEELLKCKVCQSTFTNPVLLPCFETVCQKDLIPTDGKLIIDCKFCGDQHVATADKGFPVDKRTQDFVNLFFDQLFHGVLYKNGKNCIEDLDSKFKELEVLEKDPHNYIYEYFLELKTKVDLRREELKAEIDSHSDKLIESLKRYENDCTNGLLNVNDISQEITQSRKGFDEIQTQFNEFNLTEKKLAEINDQSELLNKTVSKQMGYLKKSILKNMSYEFKSVPVNVENIFGTIKCKEEVSLADSNILSKADREHLLQLIEKMCPFNENQNWKLLYRAKRDGFEAEDFHQKCDGHLKSLTIIKTTSGAVFGGFTESDWAQVQAEGHFKFDQNAFIFSLINKQNEPLLVKCTEPARAIFCAENYGPIFGNWPHDIVIDSNSNLNYENYCNLSFSYKYHATGEDFFLAGNSCDFQTEDIEVFALQ